jgi:hypothetical protein
VSHPNAGNSIHEGTSGNYSVRAGRPRILIMEAQKSALSRNEGARKKAQERAADFNAVGKPPLTFYDHL